MKSIEMSEQSAFDDPSSGLGEPNFDELSDDFDDCDFAGIILAYGGGGGGGGGWPTCW